MGKFALASRLADEFAVSFEKASKFVDDVGATTARRLADDALDVGSRTVSDWWKPVTAGGVVVGGGALAWRQQDIETAKAIASQQQDYSSAVGSIMDSDLSPEAKRQLTEELMNSAPSTDVAGAGGADGGLLGGDIQTTIVLLVVLVFVLKFGLEGRMD